MANLEGIFSPEINKPYVQSELSETPALDISVQVPKESTTEIITDKTGVDIADSMVNNDLS